MLYTFIEQVHTGGQLMLPPPYHSFVASGRYGGPDAPAFKHNEICKSSPEPLA